MHIAGFFFNLPFFCRFARKKRQKNRQETGRKQDKPAKNRQIEKKTGNVHVPDMGEDQIRLDRFANAG